MLSRLAILSRYTGASVARQAGISRLAQSSVPLAFAHVSQRTSLSAYQGFASSAVQQWEDRSRNGGRDSRSSRPPRREFVPRQPSPPSERLYVGGITDLNRTEVSAFIQQQPGLVTLHDELHDGQRRNFVHLTFTSASEAEAAKNALHERFEQTGLRLDFATTERGNKLYIGDISPSIRPWVLEEIAKVPGFERFHDYPGREGEPKDFLHAQFQSIDNASDAHKDLTSLLEEKGVRVDFAKERRVSDALEEREVREPAPPSNELFVTNLAFYAEEAELSEAFEQIPGYVQVSLAKDFSGRNKGFARVRFETVEQATEAIESIRNLSIRDRQLRAEFANRKTSPTRPPSSVIFIGGLPYNATEEAVKNALQGHEGITNVDLRVNTLSGKPAWALVSFENTEQAQEVVAACHHKPFTLGGSPMRLDFHAERERTRSSRAEDNNPPAKSLFVGGIKDRSVDDLYEMFAEYPPKAARIATDPTGRSRGFGYVDFNSIEEAQRAKEALDGSDLGSSTVIRVDFTVDRPPRQERSSYGGGGGRGGSYGGREDRGFGGREDRGGDREGRGRGGDRGEGRGRGGGGGRGGSGGRGGGWSAGDDPNRSTYGSRGGGGGGRGGGRGGDPRGGEYPSTW